MTQDPSPYCLIGITNVYPYHPSLVTMENATDCRIRNAAELSKEQIEEVIPKRLLQILKSIGTNTSTPRDADTSTVFNGPFTN